MIYIIDYEINLPVSYEGIPTAGHILLYLVQSKHDSSAI